MITSLPAYHAAKEKAHDVSKAGSQLVFTFRLSVTSHT